MVALSNVHQPAGKFEAAKTDHTGLASSLEMTCKTSTMLFLS